MGMQNLIFKGSYSRRNLFEKKVNAKGRRRNQPKKGKRKTPFLKIFPGYVFVETIITDESGRH